MYEFNSTYNQQQLHRAFIIDTRLDEYFVALIKNNTFLTNLNSNQLSEASKLIFMIQILNLFFPYVIFPFGLFLNFFKLFIYPKYTELKNNSVTFCIRQVAVLSILITLTTLANYITVDNSSLSSSSSYSCKMFSYFYDLLTSLFSWMFVQMLFNIFSCFEDAAENKNVNIRLVPMDENSKNKTSSILVRRNCKSKYKGDIHFCHYLLLFFLMTTYIYDLFLMDLIEIKLDESYTLKFCGIRKETPHSFDIKYLIFFKYSIDFISSYLLPILFMMYKCVQLIRSTKRLVESTNIHKDQLETELLNVKFAMSPLYFSIFTLPIFISLFSYFRLLTINVEFINEQYLNFLKLKFFFTLTFNVNILHYSLFLIGLFYDKRFRERCRMILQQIIFQKTKDSSGDQDVKISIDSQNNPEVDDIIETTQ